MRAHKRIVGVLAVVMCMLLSGCGIGGCGRTEEAPQGPRYGIADMAQLMHGHPAYSDYFRLEQEYNNLLVQYEAERMEMVKKSVRAQEQLQAALTSGEIEKSLNTEFRARMTLREDEWNQRLAELYRELTLAEGEEIEAMAEGLDLEIVNLQLRLRALDLPADERADMEERLAELLAFREGSYYTGVLLSDEAIAQLEALKAEAEADLQQYAEEVMRELQAQREAEMERLTAAAQARINPVESDRWNAEWQERITAKQDEMILIEQMMTDDIRAAAARAATEKDIDVVFSDYEANIGATDLTTDILAQLHYTSEGGQTSGK